MSYNQNIESKMSVQFGFSCSHGNRSIKPNNITLSKYIEDNVKDVDEDAEFDLSTISI